MKRIIAQYSPKSVAELKIICHGVWDNLSMQTIHELVKEMPTRMIQVIANDGYALQHL